MQDIQLLEVAICYVVIAPVRNGVELNAVGELHLVLLFEPATFRGSFDVVLALPFPCFLLKVCNPSGGGCGCGSWVFYELEFLERSDGVGVVSGGGGGSGTPSSFSRCVLVSWWGLARGGVFVGCWGCNFQQRLPHGKGD